MVDENYRRKLHVQALQEIEAGVRNQVVRNENDDRAEQKRFLRLLQQEQFELDMEEAIQKVRDSVHCYLFFFFSPPLVPGRGK